MFLFSKIGVPIVRDAHGHAKIIYSFVSVAVLAAVPFFCEIAVQTSRTMNEPTSEI